VATPGGAFPAAAEVPESLGALFERPALSLQIPSDSLWEVAVDSLARWLARIGEGRRRMRDELRRAQDEARSLERDLGRARRRAEHAAGAEASAQARVSSLATALPRARDAAAQAHAAAEPARAGPGLRVAVCHREETAEEAGRLRAALALAAETDAAQADATLVLIDPGWRATAELEAQIAAALARGSAIIPLLVRRAPLPEREALPDALVPLLAHHALALPDQFWEEAVARVRERLAQIERAIAERERAAAAAAARVRELERDEARAATALEEGRAALAAARERVAELEGRLATARARAGELEAVPADANPDYLAGPPPPA